MAVGKPGISVLASPQRLRRFLGAFGSTNEGEQTIKWVSHEFR